MPRHAIRIAAALLAATPCLSVHAIEQSLGVFSGPASLPIGQSHAVVLPFEDTFSFEVGAGASLTFTAHLDAGDRRTFSDDLDARLFLGDTLVQDGWDRTVPVPPGVPSFATRAVDFTPVTLGTGLYRLVVTGTMGSVFDIPAASYDGVIGLSSVAAPVPEPAPAVLVALGLLGVGAWRRTVSRK